MRLFSFKISHFECITSLMNLFRIYSSHLLYWGFHCLRSELYEKTLNCMKKLRILWKTPNSCLIYLSIERLFQLLIRLMVSFVIKYFSLWVTVGPIKDLKINPNNKCFYSYLLILCENQIIFWRFQSVFGTKI